jgi:dipeptidyl aminopeptidase/acylaminoacyl peptidase
MAETGFHDLAQFVDIPRLDGLDLSPDGSRAVVTVAEPDDARARYITSLWEVDTDGRRPARRLTRGEQSASSPVHDGDGVLWFLRSTPADPTSSTPESTAIWRLPDAGEAERFCTRPGGFARLLAAPAAPRVLAVADVLGASPDADADLRSARKDAEVGAILHDSPVVRHWDHDLGPGVPWLLDVTTGDPRPVHGPPGAALREAQTAVGADGAVVVTTWSIAAPDASLRSVLARVDVEAATVEILVEDADADLGSPAISPDGCRVAFCRQSLGTPTQAPDVTLHVLDLGTGGVAEWASGWDRFPATPVWTRDGERVIVVADDDGRAPLVEIADPADDRRPGVRVLTDDRYAYSHPAVHPDGRRVVALRSSVDTPPHVVVVSIDDGEVAVPPGPVELPAVPGTVETVRVVADDGAVVRACLVVPEGADTDHPVPLLLWVHGGPVMSWNAWSWRWNPWVYAARGYAVLLPDPALSTGYGHAFVERGWGRWGREPFTDVMSVTDAVVADPRIDERRVAMMGGSFGGYMANWIAGHTDRFAAIVSHASLWALDQFGGTTDSAYYWQREMTPTMAWENSPHRFVGDIVTPMLIIHGDRDFRVPIGESLRLWTDLLRSSGLPAGPDGTTVHRFLYFPDENHWVLAPSDVLVWNETCLAFLADHVLDTPTPMPGLLASPAPAVRPDHTTRWPPP